MGEIGGHIMAAEIFAPSYLANFDLNIIRYANQLFEGRLSGRGSHKFRFDRDIRYSLQASLERVKDSFSLERYFSLLRSASPEETIEHFGDILRLRPEFLDLANIPCNEPFEILVDKDKHYQRSLVPLLQETLENIANKYSNKTLHVFEVGTGVDAAHSPVVMDSIIPCGESLQFCDVEDYLAPQAQTGLVKFIKGVSPNELHRICSLQTEPSESIQTMLAFNTFHHFTSLGKARRTLREIFRVLAANGTLILIETTHKRDDIYCHLTNALLDLVMHDVTNLHFIDNPVVRPFPCSLMFFSDEDLEEEMLQFGNITSSCVLEPSPVAPIRERFYVVSKRSH
jgi:hypothetical protein